MIYYFINFIVAIAELYSIGFSIKYILLNKGSEKSASVPPRGGAREPGRQLSAFRQDRANRLLEQTQRHVYGGAARAQRRGGGIMKIFHCEGEPQQELNTATTTSFVYSIYSNHGITYLQRRDPLPLIQYKYIYRTAPTRSQTVPRRWKA